MSKKEPITTDLLNIEQLEEELAREQKKVSSRALMTGLLCSLALVIVLVIVVVNLFPVYRIYGTSMAPTVDAGDVVFCIRGSSFEVGDIVAVECGGKILIKRLVAQGGDRVEIDESGTLYINGAPCSEPYASNIESDDLNAVPAVQVPEGEWYILGDNRAISGDSRLTDVGTVDNDQIVGRIIFRIYPLNEIGTIG